MDPRIILIGQVPVNIEEEHNSDTFGSTSSGTPNQQTTQNVEQTSNSRESEVPPTDMPSFASDGGATGAETGSRSHHRHTAHQIQTLEAFFTDCPNPNESDRMELSRRLGMDPIQVKIWFQNKRSHNKAQVDRGENYQLKAQTETLEQKNLMMRRSLARSTCSTCGSPQIVPLTQDQENDLSLENASLEEEIVRLQEKVRDIFGSNVVNPNPNAPHQFGVAAVEVPNEQATAGVLGGEKQPNAQGNVFDGKDGLITSMIKSNVLDREMIIKLANDAMNELISMTQVDCPLWVPSMDQSRHIFNKEAYDSMFPKLRGFATPLSFRVEATRDSNVTMMKQMDLVSVMMNTEKFAAVFSSMVSTASLLDAIITVNETGYNGFLIVVHAEYQVLTHTIPKRESIFGRYCKKLENDTWAVVDLSIQDLHETLTHKKCHRMPSGCVIQTIPDGSSRVTWVEHVRLDNEGIHPLAMPLLDSGLAFGAPKWLAVLSRQYERIATVTLPNFHGAEINTTVTDPHSRKNIMKLAEGMAKTFYNAVTSSRGHSCWKQTTNHDEKVRISMKTTKIEPGMPFGSVLRFTTSFWIPVQHGMVFEFLCDKDARKEWDILTTTGGEFHEFLHIKNGNHAGNRVSMLQLTGTNTCPNIVILQDCNIDAISSTVIYASVDPITVSMLLSGGEIPDNVEFLPSGFTIDPSRRPSRPLKNIPPDFDDSRLGSLVTAAIQVLVHPSRSTTSMFSFRSITSANQVIETKMEKLKFALLSRFV